MGICRLIPTQDVPEYWEQMKPYFAKALARGDGSITLDCTYKGLVSGTHYAIVSPYGAGVLINSVAPDGEKVLLHGPLASDPGTFKYWIDEYLDLVSALAAWLDVSTLEVIGRKGWTRYLKSRNYIQVSNDKITRERLRRYGQRRQ